MKSHSINNPCLTRGTWVIVAIVVLFSFAAYTYAAINDYELKAAYIAHFTEFIEWPKSSSVKAERTFSICVYGDHPIEKPLAQLPKLMSVDKRPIEVRRINKAAASKGCDILFVPSSENRQIVHIRRYTDTEAVLLINEVPSIPSHGQLISIYRDGNRLRIQIYLRKAQEAGFIISARLLKLANIVE